MKTWLLGLCSVYLLGCVGPTGPAGGRGPDGAPGADGAEGTRGPFGQMGGKGVDGPVGLEGREGVTGIPGEPGPVGVGPRSVGEGLHIEVLGVSLADGKASVDLLLTDEGGRPLDRTGAYTEGAVSASFVLGFVDERVDGLTLQYVSYTQQTVATDGGPVRQNAADTAGVWTELSPAGAGRYRYELTAAVDAGANASKTHSVGVAGVRVFRGQRFVANRVFHFRPDGQAVTTQREIVTTASCNQCHGQLEAHGDAREVSLCVMCHTHENALDTESGNSLDFNALIHNLHRGAQLPSVRQGRPLRFVDSHGTVHDYSTVKFPQDINRCEVCHSGADGARWKSNPSQSNCSGCHDRTWFSAEPVPSGYTLHSAGPRPDAQCTVCHSTGSLEPVEVHHSTPHSDAQRLNVTTEILAIPRVPPGARPVMTFSVQLNGEPVDVLSQPLAHLQVVVAGPNRDVERWWVEDFATVSECPAVPDAGGCLSRVDAGVFTYLSATALSLSDTGSFTAGLEACAVNDAGTQWCAPNALKSFAVTDTSPVARRTSVTLNQCNQCHDTLQAHGGARNDTRQCTLCHGPTTVRLATVPIDGGMATARSAHFKNLIHEVHSAARFPGTVKECSRCHTATGTNLPLATGVLSSRSERQSCGLLPDGGAGAPSDGGTACLAEAIVTVDAQFEAPIAASCLSCHQQTTARGHAQQNTTNGVETCSVCHAAGRSVGLDTVH